MVDANQTAEDGREMVRRHLPRWLRWTLAAAAAIVILLMCLAWLWNVVLAPTEPAPALQQAIAARLHVDVNRLSFERMAEHDGCTIVEVSTGETYQSVAAIRRDARWAITAVSTDDRHFDLDDPDWARVCTPVP